MTTNQETLLRKSLTIYNQASVKKLPDVPEYTPISFSPRHQYRMERLLNRYDRFSYSCTYTKGGLFMKKKIMLIVAIVLILIISVATVAVCMKIDQEREVDSSIYHFDEYVEKTKLYTAPDGTKVALSYKQSLTRADGTPLHYYVDIYGTEYHFDQSGELIGCSEGEEGADFYAPKPEDDTPSTEKPSANRVNQIAKDMPGLATDAETTAEEQRIVEIARQYAIDTYGEDYFAKFSYSKMIKQPAMKIHYVYFHIRYNERFITESCSVTLLDEKPHRINTFSKGEDVGFDPQLLQNVDITTLEEFVKQKVDNEFGDECTSYEIEENITISKKDAGQFELIIAVQVKTDPLLSSQRVKYYYPLG